MRMIVIIAVSLDSAAKEAAAVYAEHNTFHLPVDVKPFKGRVYVGDIPMRHATQSHKVPVKKQSVDTPTQEG